MKEIGKIRFKLAMIPISILFALVFAPLPLYFLHLFDYFAVMPLIIFLSAFFIFLVGAWWDFGAHNYLKDLFVSKDTLKEDDIVNINRQQLIMTGIFILIGLTYMIIAVIIYII